MYGPVPGTGCRADVAGHRRARRNRSREPGDAQGAEQVGIRLDEMDRHRVGRIVRDDAGGEVAMRRPRRARRRADDVTEITGGRLLEDEGPFEPAPEIAGPHWLTIRILDIRPELEDIRQPPVRRGRELLSQVGYEIQSGQSGGPAQGDEGVVNLRHSVVDIAVIGQRRVDTRSARRPGSPSRPSTSPRGGPATRTPCC